MPSVVIDNTVQMRITWAITGVPFAINVLHGIKDIGIAGVGQADADAMADSLETAFDASGLGAHLGSSVSLTEVGLRDLNEANFPEYVAAIAGSAGTASTSLLPLNVALCCTLRTNKAGRRFRGRYYQTGFTEGTSDSTGASPAVMTALKAWLDQIALGMAANGLQLAVASRVNGTSEPVTSALVRDRTWDTQRRRIVPGI